MQKQNPIENYTFITPDGVEFNLLNSARCILSMTGSGMPPVKYLTEQGPLQHGVNVIDYRLQQRVIQLLLREDTCSRTEWWAARHRLLDMLRPNRQTIGHMDSGHFRITRPDGTQRQIDCWIESGPSFEPRSLDQWDEWGIQETIRFIAPYPQFYDPTRQCVDLVPLVLPRELVFPIIFRDPVFYPGGYELVFSGTEVSASASADVPYAGNWPDFPSFQIYGPLTRPTVYNDITGEFISLNTTIALGEVITVALPPGAKQVFSSTRQNIIGTVTDQSKLATFHLEPHPGAPNGINPIRLTGYNALIGQTMATMTYFNEYIGT